MLTEAVEPEPTDAYGKSKLAAERGLAELDLDWVALRAVLVYGPGVKGNMAQLMRLARSPYPLPINGFTARRSLLALENLAAAVEVLLTAPGTLRPTGLLPTRSREWQPRDPETGAGRATIAPRN